MHQSFKLEKSIVPRHFFFSSSSNVPFVFICCQAVFFQLHIHKKTVFKIALWYGIHVSFSTALRVKLIRTFSIVVESLIFLPKLTHFVHLKSEARSLLISNTLVYCCHHKFFLIRFLLVERGGWTKKNVPSENNREKARHFCFVIYLLASVCIAAGYNCYDMLAFLFWYDIVIKFPAL